MADLFRETKSIQPRSSCGRPLNTGMSTLANRFDDSKLRCYGNGEEMFLEHEN